MPDSRYDETAVGDLLAAALTYAAGGLPVLPLADKVPRNSGGLTNASSDPAVIAEWWRRWPTANIGVRTGAVSRLLLLGAPPPKGGGVTRAGAGTAEPAPPAARRPGGGMGEAAIAAALLDETSTRGRPPLENEEVRAIAASVAGYESAIELGRPSYTGPP